MKTKWFSGIGSFGGSFFSVGCPACVPAIAGLFSAMGLGFMVNMKILGPLTIALLSLGIAGLYFNSKKHNKNTFLIIGVIASIIVYGSRYAVESQIPMYAGAVVLLGNAFTDYKHVRKKSCCISKKKE